MVGIDATVSDILLAAIKNVGGEILGSYLRIIPFVQLSHWNESSHSLPAATSNSSAPR